MEELAGDYPSWGMLNAIGLSDAVLHEVILNDLVEDPVLCNLPDLPSHGVLMELYYFCLQFSSVEKMKVNVILKKCVDFLFPSCVVSRADRLECRVQGFCVAFKSMSKQEQVLYLQKHWRPQPTGTTNKFGVAVHE